MKLNCPKCHSTDTVLSNMITQTLVGYVSPPGHDHDDNCICREVNCVNCNHVWRISKIRTCPSCNWVGQPECRCHYGQKLFKWPDEI